MLRANFRLCLCLWLSVGLLGCAEHEFAAVGNADKTVLIDDNYSTPSDAPPEFNQQAALNSAVAEDEVANEVAPARQPPAAENPATDITQQPKSPQRKIVYNASLSLVVDDLEDTKQEMLALINANGGFLSQFHEDRMYGDQLSGHWVVRVPGDRFQTFVDDAQKLGVPESQQIQAEEVTEQFVDLEARLKVQREMEQELLEILRERSEKTADAIEVQKALGPVRSTIEQIEGRLRYLRDQVAMSTITIDAREEKNYVPPQAPTFAAMIGATFGNSLSMMAQFGQGVVLFFVAVIPWLIAMCVLLLPIYILFAVRRRQARKMA